MSASAPRRILIVGASGIVGRAAFEHFLKRDGWEAYGISRRKPDLEAGTHLSVDLLDIARCREAIGSLPAISHVVFAALQEKPGLVEGWFDAEQMETNRRLLESLLDSLEPRGTLEHVSLLQGTKAYGAHVHAVRVPGRERDARDPHENFYWLQEDLLRDRARRNGYGFTIWRPPIIFGHAFGAPMNPLAPIGLFAAISQAEGKPLCWPGGRTGPIDGMDARLLARAFEWAASCEAARDEVFNISNGDVFVWKNVWGRIAETMGMEVGDPEPLSLVETMPAKAATWAALVREHALRAPGLMEFVGDSFVYMDMQFGFGRDRPAPPALLSTIKLRQAGFGECIDSEDMLVEWLEWMQGQRLLPRRSPPRN